MPVYLLESTWCSVLEVVADEDLLVLETIVGETARFHSERCYDNGPFAGLSGSGQESDEATIKDE